MSRRIINILGKAKIYLRCRSWGRQRRRDILFIGSPYNPMPTYSFEQRRGWEELCRKWEEQCCEQEEQHRKWEEQRREWEELRRKRQEQRREWEEQRREWEEQRREWKELRRKREELRRQGVIAISDWVLTTSDGCFDPHSVSKR
ncbi:MAG: hypothetical protein KME32_14880 [Mojavia pulchra JT2-VF2]|uniref:Uncharacterized protein n=1 Tax=Mojavia pulchra JT2-VF2 TaxID=287848 RepID=A0A951PXR7_9NOST|nr:hypothetical protein [Mojavia pulchra JT2-VF2]